ncbi:hypothetical protein ACSBR2_013361 [Camellia fascicularis]
MVLCVVFTDHRHARIQENPQNCKESSDLCSELNGADGSESLNTKRRKRVLMRAYDCGRRRTGRRGSDERD